jgi:hypothetical protein
MDAAGFIILSSSFCRIGGRQATDRKMRAEKLGEGSRDSERKAESGGDEVNQMGEAISN